MNEYSIESYQLEPASLENVYLELTEENYEINSSEIDDDIEISDNNIQSEKIEFEPKV